MNGKNLKQILSTSLSLAMVVSSMPIPAGAFGPVDATAPAFVAKLTPPEQFGYVSSSYAPNGEAMPRLIVISDLHGHVQVQKNIIGMLAKFVDAIHSTTKVPILVEGGWTPNLEEPLKNVTNSNVRTFLDEYLLHKSELSAAQAYSEEIAGSGKVSLIGVENEGEYKRNKEVFVKTYPARKALIIALRREEKALKKLSGAISNRSFLALQQTRDDYYAGKVQPEQFARLLVRQAAHLGITGRYVDVLKNSSSSNPNDLDVAYSEIYKAVAIRLSESRPMTAFLRQSIGNEEDMRQKIAIIDSRLDLLKRLVGNQLTPAEVPLAMARMEELVQVAELLVPANTAGINVADVVRDSLTFYPYAMVRNESLVKNSLAALDKMGPDTTGILIAGGFHTEAIDQYLRDHHIAYMQVNPTITRDISADEQFNYIKRVCDDHVTSAELASDLDSLAHGGRTQLASAAIGPSTFLNQGQEGSDPGKPPVGQKLADGLTPGQVALLEADKPAIAAALSSLSATAAQAVAAADAGAEDVQKVLDLANAERIQKGQTAISPMIFTQVVHVDRGADGQFVGQGVDADGAAYILNQALAQIAGTEAGAHIRGMNIAFVDNVKAVGAGAEILGVHEGQGGVPLLIMDKERGQAILKLREIQEGIKSGKIDAKDPAVDAVFRAVGDFAHEVLGHAFNPEGKVEVSALRVGVAQAVALAVSHFAGLPGMGSAQDVAERALRALNQEFADVQVQVELEPGTAVTVSAWEAIVPGLAKMIASLVGGPEVLSEAQVQEVITKVQNVLPDLTDYQIRTAINHESSRLESAAYALGGNQGDKDKINQTVAGITGDANAIEANQAATSEGKSA
jgi:hypothetical protein